MTSPNKAYLNWGLSRLEYLDSLLPSQGADYEENGKIVYWNFAQPTISSGTITHEPTTESYYDSVNNCYPAEIKRIDTGKEVFFIAKWEVTGSNK